MRHPITAFATTMLALSGLQAATLHAQEESGPGPFQAEHIFDLEYVQSPRIGPNAENLAYVRTRMDRFEDRRRGELWMMHIDGRDNFALVQDEPVGSFTWSPDGQFIAYTTRSAESGQSLIKTVEVSTGRTQRLVQLAQSPGGLVWSPDGEHLAFTSFVPAEPATMGSRPKPPEGADWAPAPEVIDRLQFRLDGRGDIPPGDTHVFVLPSEGGSPRQLTEGARSFSGPAWSADSRALFVSGDRDGESERQPLESELYHVAIADGELIRLTDRDGPDFLPRVAPDGGRLAFMGFDDKGTSHHQNEVYLMTLPRSIRDGQTPEVRELTTDLDRHVTQLRWRPDEKGLYILYQDEGKTVLASLDFNGRTRKIADNIGGMAISRPYSSGDFDVSARSSLLSATPFFAYPMALADRPAELGIKVGSDDALQATDINGDLMALADIQAPEKFTIQSSTDDQEIDYWMVTPPGFDAEADAAYPMILEIHGGPHTAYGPDFAAEIQRFAAEGYVAVYANPRGSTSYGADFALEIDKAYPGEDAQDLLDVVDAVVDEGYVDPNRLYVTGGSGGGVLTAWLVGMTDRFAAAVVAKPVINWTSFVLSADLTGYFAEYWFGAMPWEDREAYWSRSPLSQVGTINTPTMLLTGEADYRTPMWETEQFYTALKLKGVDTAMVRIPGASHSIAQRPSQMISKIEAILTWFERHDPGDQEKAPEGEDGSATDGEGETATSASNDDEAGDHGTENASGDDAASDDNAGNGQGDEDGLAAAPARNRP